MTLKEEPQASREVFVNGLRPLRLNVESKRARLRAEE